MKANRKLIGRQAAAGAAVLFLFLCLCGPAQAAGFSLRFFGNGQNDIDRVKIPIDNPAVPADIGSTDITIEFWMKANPGENGATTCIPGNDGWMTGNVIVDRDVFGPGDFGDYGISLFQNGIAFGVNNGTTGEGICGTSDVADSRWHHVAVTRRISDGQMQLYVDGMLQAQATGPTGDISYRDGRATTYPNDPFLVIGAEKHDLGPGYPSYSGWIDEIRLSTTIRYTTNFTRPSAPFAADANTAALYHFDEGAGDTINDSSTGGASGGVRHFGGSPAGPGWSADKAPLGGISVNFTPVITTGLSQPVAITNAGDGSNRLFITEQAGNIRLWDGSTLSTYMTVPGVLSGGERGLLSVAFHPQYASNGYFFVYYTDTNGNIQVDRFTVSANPNQGDPTTRQPIINVPHPGQSNHNGGQLQFGPNGYLYMGTGDGGGAGDPSGNAQNINVLLGKILRLDIDSGLPYTIPPDNPFVGVPGADEIWDYGVRNPWRFSFDRVLGDLLIGDVGQSAREEVDFEPSNSPGGINYGWNNMEGSICYQPPTGCQTVGRTLPVLEYTHNPSCSITGGYRYRGTQIPEAYGSYFYGDYCSGRLWAGAQQGLGTWTATQLADTTYAITTFGEDEAGEVYMSDYNVGAIYRLTDSIANLSVTQVDSPDPVVQGSTLNYTMTVTNSGPSAATATSLVQELPAGVTFVSASNPGCAHNAGVVTCNLGTMAAGATISFQVHVTADVAGTVTSRIVASADQSDSNPSNNEDADDTQIVAPVEADLSLVKTDAQDPVTVGTDITYNIVVTNNGPSNATGLILTDTLPAAVTFVSAPGCSEAGGTVTCAIGDLNAGSNVTFTIVANATAAGVVTNTASVSGNEADPVPLNNADSEDTTVTPVCLFCDDFEDGVLAPDWTYTRSTSDWSESGGSLHGFSLRKATAVATPVFAGCMNCSVQTVMRSSGGTGSRVSLIHHFVDKGNEVELIMKEDTDRWILKQRVGRRVVARAKASLRIDPDVPYQVQISYNGSQYLVTVDGTQILTLIPAGPVTGGTVGFRVKGATGVFDSIQVN